MDPDGVRRHRACTSSQAEQADTVTRHDILPGLGAPSDSFYSVHNWIRVGFYTHVAVLNYLFHPEKFKEKGNRPPSLPLWGRIRPSRSQSGLPAALPVRLESVTQPMSHPLTSHHPPHPLSSHCLSALEARRRVGVAFTFPDYPGVTSGLPSWGKGGGFAKIIRWTPAHRPILRLSSAYMASCVAPLDHSQMRCEGKSRLREA
jgi:hypothetical protein